MAIMIQNGFVFIEDDAQDDNEDDIDDFIGLNVYEKIQLLLYENEYFVQNNIK